MNGLIGRKVGMTRIFTEDGTSIPVTVIEVKKNYIIQIKNLKKNNFYKVQITTGKKKKKLIKKPELGQFLKAGFKKGSKLWELNYSNIEKINVGDNISLKNIINVKKVDITGISKGKGFTGTVKRWNFHTQDATHGNSLSHRTPGSIGQNQTPGKVFKGKKMAGQLGNTFITVKRLIVIKIDVKKQLMLVKGAVPGATGGYLIIKSTQ